MAEWNAYFEGLNAQESGIKVTTETPSPGYCLIRLEGFLDTNNSNLFMEVMLKLIAQEAEIKKLRIEMAKLTYASSTGIGSLTNILVHCQKASIDFALAAVDPKVMDVMKLLGFAEFFVFEDRI